MAKVYDEEWVEAYQGLYFAKGQQLCVAVMIDMPDVATAKLRAQFCALAPRMAWMMLEYERITWSCDFCGHEINASTRGPGSLLRHHATECPLGALCDALRALGGGE